MDSSRPTIHRTIVWVDVEAYGDPVRNRAALLNVRDSLWTAMEQAFLAADIPWSCCQTQDGGDGILVLAPGERKGPFAEALPSAMALMLRKHNATHPEAERIRLRMALHAGEVAFDKKGFAGKPLILASRLLAADPVRAVLKASSGVLVLVVSQLFYDEVVTQGDAFEPGTYRAVQIRLKETAVTGWVSRPDDPFPASGPRQPRSRRFVAGAAAGALVLAAGLTADTPFFGPGPEIGADRPAESEFVAKVVNQQSHKCLARNGIYSQDDATHAERVGEHVYQWDCAEPDADPGHTLVLTPAAQEGWTIRSSVNTDLCLTADGTPSADQHFQVCQPRDETQQWRLRSVLGQGRDVVVIENEETGLCLAAAADPSDINLGQVTCIPHGATEWEIRRYPGIGEHACAESTTGRLRNRETRSYAVDERGGPIELTPTPAGRSAQGCASVFTDAAGRCLGLAGNAAAVRTLPCTGRPDQQWITESRGTASGLSWSRIHALANLSKCLQPDGNSLAVQLCGPSWPQQWHFG